VTCTCTGTSRARARGCIEKAEERARIVSKQYRIERLSGHFLLQSCAHKRARGRPVALLCVCVCLRLSVCVCRACHWQDRHTDVSTMSSDGHFIYSEVCRSAFLSERTSDLILCRICCISEYSCDWLFSATVFMYHVLLIDLHALKFN